MGTSSTRAKTPSSAAVISDVAERNQAGQPVLLGTISIERSEKLSRLLDREGIKHEVLNAKQHAREADIIAQAGRPGAVTVATNMAGRGVDIMLGGNPDGMAKTELKRRGVTPDDPSYQELERKLAEEFEPQIEPDKQTGDRRRRAVRRGYRAPRVAPHRQPAAGTIRASGRPR